MEQQLLRHAPLRQTVFEVIPPGQAFTVPEITRCLNDLGIPASATVVSNALGYWVSRGRVDRVRKGVYQTLIGTRQTDRPDLQDPGQATPERPTGVQRDTTPRPQATNVG